MLHNAEAFSLDLGLGLSDKDFTRKQLLSKTRQTRKCLKSTSIHHSLVLYGKKAVRLIHIDDTSFDDIL